MKKPSSPEVPKGDFHSGDDGIAEQGGVLARGLSRRRVLYRMAMIASVLTAAWFLTRASTGMLGLTRFPDGTEVSFLRYTHGTIHEFGRGDLRRKFNLPDIVWNTIGYKPGFHATFTESEPCTIVWARVKWNSARQEPYPANLHVQSVEADGARYPWELVQVYQFGPNELILPYRARGLPPSGGKLSIRVMEKVEQHRPVRSKDWLQQNAGRREPKSQVTAVVTVPNPQKRGPAQIESVPLPQSQISGDLTVTLHSLRSMQLEDGEFALDARFQLSWKGVEAPGAFAIYYTISTPRGDIGKHNRWSSTIDNNRFPFLTYVTPPDQKPRTPMRGHKGWLVNLHVVSTAFLPGLLEEPGLPLFTEAVAVGGRPTAAETRARNKLKKGWFIIKPSVSPKAVEAGLKLGDIWPPRGLHLVVHRTPPRHFPPTWKKGDPLPFVVLAEANGKRVTLSSSSYRGGYGPDGLASQSFNLTEVPQRLAYGDDRRWNDTMPSITDTESLPIPEAIGYCFVPRRYWTFSFPVAPVDPPRR